MVISVPRVLVFWMWFLTRFYRQLFSRAFYYVFAARVAMRCCLCIWYVVYIVFHIFFLSSPLVKGPREREGMAREKSPSRAGAVVRVFW